MRENRDVSAEGDAIAKRVVGDVTSNISHGYLLLISCLINQIKRMLVSAFFPMFYPSSDAHVS